MSDKRGPKIGDAASLWNFTPSPGWTKEEAQILKLCLMKHGVGRWVQILDSGLLPGKLIQQLNGQTQRLLGQQSLAAYTGLRVDIDRIRQDNEARVDAQRKSGLIIYDGPNLTKEAKEKLQEESKEKYGLTDEQIAAVDLQLEEIHAERMKKQDEIKTHREELTVLKSESIPSIQELEHMNRSEKIKMLRGLYAKLQKAQTIFRYHVELSKQQVFQRHKVATNQGSGRENRTANGEIVRTLSGSKHKDSLQARASGPVKKQRSAKKSTTAKRRQMKSSEEEDIIDNDIVRECQRAGVEANIDALVAMGFARRQVIDALEEANGSVEGAVDWLTVHCI